MLPPEARLKNRSLCPLAMVLLELTLLKKRTTRTVMGVRRLEGT